MTENKNRDHEQDVADVIRAIDNGEALCVLHTVEHPVLIGIGGFKESGKDALAKRLQAKHGYRRRGMSDPLLEWTLAENPWLKIDMHRDDPTTVATIDGYLSAHDLNGVGIQNHGFVRARDIIAALGYDTAKKIREYRTYLQLIGTEAGRAIVSDTVWVDVASARIEADLAMGHNVVITGIRYENEIEMIRDLGGTVIWVERPSATQAHMEALATADSTAAHTSEVTLQQTDFRIVLDNDGTLADLEKVADTMATQWWN